MKNTTEISTDLYERSHNKLPRGRGSWAFHPNRNFGGAESDVLWINDSWGQAKRKAIAHYTALGIELVYVGS